MMIVIYTDRTGQEIIFHGFENLDDACNWIKLKREAGWNNHFVIDGSWHKNKSDYNGG